MILIIFIVNTVHLNLRISSSSQGTVTKEGNDCLRLLSGWCHSHWVVCHKL